MVSRLAGWLLLGMILPAGASFAADGPTTAPAPLAAAAPAGSVPGNLDVAVEPFARLGESSQVPAWVGAAVQQNLISELARLHFHPQASDPATTQLNAAAVYRVRGSYQSSGDAIRFDGQVTETATGRVVGGISATGPVRDLFGLEDAVTAQTVHRLRQLTSPADAAAPMTQHALAEAVQPPSAAPTATDGYDGSVLQAYVNSNSVPSNDYADQENASRTRQTYAADYSTGVYPYGGFGYPGVFYGTSFYPFGAGGFGYGGFGYGGLGRGYAFGHGGNYGYGFGGGGFRGGGYGGGFHGSGGFGR